jgi:hypothetical protein
MGTVYITQDSAGRNFLPAREFGELQALLPGNAQLILSATPIIRKLKRGLKDFCDEDCLLLSGDPAIIGLATAVAMEMNLGRARLLKWDKRENNYYAVAVDMHEKGDRDD